MVSLATLKELEYIRLKYQKPAFIGVEVRAKDIYPNEIGTITGTDGAYLQVSYEFPPKTRTFHPRDLAYIGVKLIK